MPILIAGRPKCRPEYRHDSYDYTVTALFVVHIITFRKRGISASLFAVSFLFPEKRGIFASYSTVFAYFPEIRGISASHSSITALFPGIRGINTLHMRGSSAAMTLSTKDTIYQTLRSLSNSSFFIPLGLPLF